MEKFADAVPVQMPLLPVTVALAGVIRFRNGACVKSSYIGAFPDEKSIFATSMGPQEALTVAKISRPPDLSSNQTLGGQRLSAGAADSAVVAV